MLTGAAAVAGDPGSEPSVRIALMHGIVLFFGLGRPDAALDRLGHASAAVAGSGLPAPEASERAAVLDSMRALLLTQGGRSREALDALPAAAPSDPVMRAVYARAHAWAHYRTGDAEAAAETALEAWEAGIREDSPAGLLHPAGDLMVAALAHLELGRPEEARALAAKGRDVAIAQGMPFQAAWLAWAVATVDLVMGYAEDAEAAFRELAATAGRGGFAQVEHLAALGLTECRALTGDTAGAQAWFDRAEALPPAAPAFAPATVMARAWLSAADGDGRQAATLLRGAGLELAAREELREAVVLLDEAAMFGDHEAANALLAVIDRVPTPVGRARRLRAQALLDGHSSRPHRRGRGLRRLRLRALGRDHGRPGGAGPARGRRPSGRGRRRGAGARRGPTSHPASGSRASARPPAPRC